MTGAKDRPSLGFGDELDGFDPAAWVSKPKASSPTSLRLNEVPKQAAEAAGLRSREPGGRIHCPSQCLLLRNVGAVPAGNALSSIFKALAEMH